ncbi:ABC transporter substrate-binding protein [Actinokineospora sp. NPDC004072]
MKRALAAALAATTALAGCSAEAAGSAVEIVIGYQSKTINTVTAGTLLRDLGFFEKRLAELSARTGVDYTVTWQDYDTGAPITAQMVAGKVDIGSMGDFPLLINASRAQELGDEGTQMVSVTGYNARGGLNMVVVAPDSPATTLADLAGTTVSASVGSAGHGTLVRALQRAGVEGVTVENQQPPVGASALRAGSVAALAQFVAWPGMLVHDRQARLLYDGSALGIPTLHGVVVRKPFAAEHPDLLAEFLRAQLDATEYLHANPLAAAEKVAAATGIAPEVVYLYNGPNGISTFDLDIKPQLRQALREDVPLLERIGDIAPVDVDAFIDDSALTAITGPPDDDTTNPARITGQDRVCGVAVEDPATAGEVWLAGEGTTRPAATPTCLLKHVNAAGGTVRAAYVPDAETGTRWFAEHAVWVRDGADFLPFTTADGARRHLAAHPGAQVLDYPAAVQAAGR